MAQLYLCVSLKVSPFRAAVTERYFRDRTPPPFIPPGPIQERGGSLLLIMATERRRRGRKKEKTTPFFMECSSREPLVLLKGTRFLLGHADKKGGTNKLSTVPLYEKGEVSLYSIFGFLQNCRPTTTLAYYYLQQKSLVARMPGLDLYATRVFFPSSLPRLCCSPTGEEKALRGGGAIIQHFLRLEEEMGFEEEKVMLINKK